MRFIILCLCLTILCGCQSKQANIVVLGEKAQGRQNYVLNGGPGSTEAVYEDDKGNSTTVASNVVKVPIKEICDEIKDETPKPVEETPDQAIPDEPIEELEDTIPPEEQYPLEVKTVSSQVLAAGYERPEVSFKTDVFIPRKPPKIKLKKLSDEDVLCCDRQLTYRIRFTNVGGDEARNVEISDVVPTRVEYVEESAGAEPYITSVKIDRGKNDRAQKITWRLEGSIPPGGAGEVFYTVVCPKRRPKLACFVRFEPKALNVGEEGNVICTVSNTGTGKAEGVKLDMIIPQGIEYQGKSVGQKASFKLGIIEAGKNSVETLRVRMRSGGRLDNIVANIVAANGDSCECIVPPAPTLKIQKTGPAKTNNRLPVEYTIVAKNVSSKKAPASNCILTDKLPPLSNFKVASHEGSYDAKTHTVTWKLGTLMPGDIAARTVVIIPRKAIELIDKAQVSCDEGITVTDTAKTIVRGITALHVLSYDTEDPVEVGGVTTYIVEVINEGFKDATGVKIVSSLPRLTKYLAAQGRDSSGRPVGHKVEGDKVVFDPIPSLPSGEKVILKITVRVTEKTQLLNVTSVNYNEFSKTIIVEEPTSSY